MDLFSSLIKMISSLFVVLGIMILIAYGAKRYFGARLGLWRSEPLIQVLARTYLGGKREIAVIEVGEAFLVVGVTANQVSLLTRLEKSPLRSNPPSEMKDFRGS